MCFYQELANTIRLLSIDAVEKAKSGHPGAPMGMADIATILWKKHLSHSPSNPNWFNRDRFILSNGHSSMLLYSLLHLTGYSISIEDLKNFRQIHSKTPGHPEFNNSIGIETTTGPLGQGIANAIGFAIAEKTLSFQFNKKDFDIVNHYTYAFVGDGCIMEGISHESCSLAGTLQLGKLIVFYDKNNISIDGETSGWNTEDTAKRFNSYNWHVLDNIDGHKIEEIDKAIQVAKKISNKPSLIICKTIIGYGSPNKSNSSDAHGAPLGETEIKLVRKKLNWKYPPFFVPKKIYSKWNAIKEGKQKENIWEEKIKKYSKKYPILFKEFIRRISKKLPNNWNENFKKIIYKLQKNPKNIATRIASKYIIEKFTKIIPEYIGGSADLSPSNQTFWSKAKPINVYNDGNYIHYGVREFAMTAIANGISLHGGFIPSTATFLVFMDYAKNAIRLASLMKIRHIMIYTHDSIGLGEDGPTHQPIEQICNLRSIPNMNIWRPCDQVESAVAWKKAIERNGPSALIFSRQNLKQQSRTLKKINKIQYGGYILKNCKKNPELIIIATGSEVQIAVEIYQILLLENYQIRVVSMPSTDVFDQQDEKYRNKVLPVDIRNRIAIEAGNKDFWYKYVGIDGLIFGINKFGISAPSEKAFEFFGFNTKNIIKKIKKYLKYIRK